MSEKAKSKMPYDAPLEYTWTGAKATRVLTRIVDYVNSKVVFSANSDPSVLINKVNSLNVLQRLNDVPDEYTSKHSKFEPLKFTWSNLSLGWYESILWGSIYLNNDVGRSKGLLNDLSYTFKKVGSDWSFGSWSKSKSKSKSKSSSGSIGESLFGLGGGNNNTNNNGGGVSEEQITQCCNNSLSCMCLWSGTQVRLFKINTKEYSNTSNNMAAAVARTGSRPNDQNLAKRASVMSYHKRNSSVYSNPSGPTSNNNVTHKKSVSVSSQPGPVPRSPLSVPLPVSGGIGDGSSGSPKLFRNPDPFSNHGIGGGNDNGGSDVSSVPGSPIGYNPVESDEFANLQLKLTSRSSVNLSRVSTRDIPSRVSSLAPE
ncbi:unnamed protein product [Ambrosiozyma monospora]|uniref:Unnamed protein product n=1 Tax=Ambrosiozyma monospora TaxID=43982 RepID=A0ACB5T7C1_AMBMO|nr:unnamed protein product [Ambrosiozyma monospora]